METITFSFANNSDRKALVKYCTMLHNGNEEDAQALMQRVEAFCEKYSDRVNEQFVYTVANNLYIAHIRKLARAEAEKAKNEILKEYGVITK